MGRAALTAEQAATRLGVKRETLYAYVSRGVLSRTLSADGRTSRFDASEIDELARRGRPRKGASRVGGIEVSIATSVTAVHPGRLLFRGRDAEVLAATSTFEAVSELLWTAALPDHVTWADAHPAQAQAMTLARKLGAVLPRAVSPIERFATVCAAIGPLFPLRGDVREPAVLAHGRALIMTLASSLPLLRGADKKMRGTEKSDTTLAARLWPCFSRLPATPARVALLDAALVLLSDHELATSTMAARVAASTRADPFSVILAGLGAMNGPLHGKAAMRVEALLDDAARSSAESALARAAGAPRTLPGFGHPVYQEHDPRAEHLLGALTKVASREAMRRIDEVRKKAAAAGAPFPNVDFALGALAHAMDMASGSTEAIFALARVSGHIAHALEEYGEEPLRFRARAIYVGA
jgi:citrate synthase